MTLENLDLEDLLDCIDPGIYSTCYYNSSWTFFNPLVRIDCISGTTAYAGADGDYDDADDAVLSYGKSANFIDIDCIIDAYCHKHKLSVRSDQILELLEELKLVEKFDADHLVWHPSGHGDHIERKLLSDQKLRICKRGMIPSIFANPKIGPFS